MICAQDHARARRMTDGKSESRHPDIPRTSFDASSVATSDELVENPRINALVSSLPSPRKASSSLTTSKASLAGQKPLNTE